MKRTSTWELWYCIFFSSNIIQAIINILKLSIDTRHPNMEMQRQNFDNFNGEDIELASRELSESTKSVRGRSDVSLSFLFQMIVVVWNGGSQLSLAWNHVEAKSAISWRHQELSFHQRLHGKRKTCYLQQKTRECSNGIPKYLWLCCTCRQNNGLKLCICLSSTKHSSITKWVNKRERYFHRIISSDPS